MAISGILNYLFHHEANMAPLRARMDALTINMTHFSRGIIPSVAEAKYKLVVESDWRNKEANLESATNRRRDVTNTSPEAAGHMVGGAQVEGYWKEDEGSLSRGRREDDGGRVKRRRSGSPHRSPMADRNRGSSRRMSHDNIGGRFDRGGRGSGGYSGGSSGLGPISPYVQPHQHGATRRGDNCHSPDYCPPTVAFCKRFVMGRLCVPPCKYCHCPKLLRLRKQQYCPDLQRGRRCLFGETCTYSHNQAPHLSAGPVARWSGTNIHERSRTVDTRRRSRERDVRRGHREHGGMGGGGRESGGFDDGSRRRSQSDASAFSGYNLQMRGDRSVAKEVEGRGECVPCASEDNGHREDSKKRPAPPNLCNATGSAGVSVSSNPGGEDMGAGGRGRASDEPHPCKKTRGPDTNPIGSGDLACGSVVQSPTRSSHDQHEKGAAVDLGDLKSLNHISAVDNGNGGLRKLIEKDIEDGELPEYIMNSPATLTAHIECGEGPAANHPPTDVVAVTSIEDPCSSAPAAEDRSRTDVPAYSDGDAAPPQPKLINLKNQWKLSAPRPTSDPSKISAEISEPSAVASNQGTEDKMTTSHGSSGAWDSAQHLIRRKGVTEHEQCSEAGEEYFVDRWEAGHVRKKPTRGSSRMITQVLLESGIAGRSFIDDSGSANHAKKTRSQVGKGKGKSQQQQTRKDKQMHVAEPLHAPNKPQTRKGSRNSLNVKPVPRESSIFAKAVTAATGFIPDSTATKKHLTRADT